MAIPPIVALEIGTTKVVAVVGELRADGHVMITGIGEHPSAGVRKGEITDLENAVVCARAALAMAEENGRVAIREVHLAVSGGHILSMANRGTVPVLDREQGISRDDIDQVMDVARAVNLPPDREILHTICQHFGIDNQEKVVKPEGLEGAKLSLDMLVLHGVRARLNNTAKVAKNIPVHVQDLVFSGLCSALAVLTPDQKKSGVVCIDCGGGTTDYIAYAGGVVAAAGCFGLGGDHVTNDIAMAFTIPSSHAEVLKRQSGCAVVRAASPAQRVNLPPDVGFQGRSVSLRALHTVIHARMDEILGMVKRRLAKEGVLQNVGAGVVLTGGAAHMKGIAELAQRIFGLPCSIGRPRNMTGLATPTEGPEYATCSGLVQYGFRTGEARPPSPADWLRRWLGLKR
jgi:cell division protein FtsA